jgi:hypothetical protein
MYLQKLKEQLAFMEEMQKQCSRLDTAEAIELAKQILQLARAIDNESRAE